LEKQWQKHQLWKPSSSLAVLAPACGL
jgi:hypothetical protein